MDELDRGGRVDVEVPKTIIGAESTKRKSASFTYITILQFFTYIFV